MNLPKTIAITMVVAALLSIMLSSGAPNNAITISGEKIITKAAPPQDTAIVQEYLRRYPPDAITYTPVDSRKDFVMKAGNVPEDIQGYRVNNKDYAVHLIYCDRENNACTFRVNGEATGYIHQGESDTNSIALDANNVLKVNNITFDFCDHRRFCDGHFQAYDVADVSIIQVTE